MIVHDVNFYVDFTDLDFSTKFEKEFKNFEMKNKIISLKFKNKQIDSKACNFEMFELLKNSLAETLGKEKIEEVLNGTKSYQKLLDVISALFDEKEKQSAKIEETVERFNNLREKYKVKE